MTGSVSIRELSFALLMHSSSVNSTAVPLRRKIFRDRQLSPMKCPACSRAISVGAELMLLSRFAISRTLPLRTMQTSSL